MKKEYNRLLTRWKKAESVELELAENALPELLKISKRLGELLDEIGFYVVEDALDGFKIID